MLRQLSLIVAFSIVGFCGLFAQSANGQASINKTFATAEECKEAYANGLYVVYQSVYRSHSRDVKGLPTEYLPSNACVKMDVVNGVGSNARYIVQDRKILMVKQGGVYTHRADCGNKIYDVVFLEDKEVGYKCPDDSKWDPVKKKCIVDGEVAVNCKKGTWDEGKQKCITEAEETIVCKNENYEYNERLGKCVYIAEEIKCPEGKPYDAKKGKCVKPGRGFPWKWVGYGALAVGGGYAIYKVATHDCKTCPTTVPTKTLPTNRTGTESRPTVLSMVEGQNGQFVLSNSSNNASVSQGNASNSQICAFVGGKRRCIGQ